MLCIVLSWYEQQSYHFIMYELTGKWKTCSKYTGENAHRDEKYVETEVKLTNLSV